MGIPVYPSLSSYAGSLTEPREVIPSLLRHMFATPASSSDHYENIHDNWKISFRRMEAEYGHSPAGLCGHISEELNDVIKRYFPDRRFQIDVYHKLIDEKTNEPVEDNDGKNYLVRYNIYIDIQEIVDDGNKIPVIYSNLVSVDSETHVFNIKFEGARHV